MNHIISSFTALRAQCVSEGGKRCQPFAGKVAVLILEHLTSVIANQPEGWCGDPRRRGLRTIGSDILWDTTARCIKKTIR